MPRVCVICKRQQSSSLSVFRFPTSIDHQAAWVRVIRNVHPNFAKTQDAMHVHMKNGLCEIHFDKKDISKGRHKCRLKRDAIPLIWKIEIENAVDIAARITCKDKFTQTDILNELQLKDFSCVRDVTGEDQRISECTVCRNSGSNYGHRLTVCDKSVLTILSEICLLDQTSYESEMCFSCIDIIREIIQFKSLIQLKTALLLNLYNNSSNSSYNNDENTDLINKYDRSMGVKLITANKASDCAWQSKKKVTFNCSVCPKLFYTRHLHLLHEASHKKCFDCQICGRFLTTKAHLQLHLYKFHAIGEPKKQLHRCSYCDRAFSTKAGLRYHETVLHTGKASYVCETCHKTFKSNLLYKSHLLFAHGEKTVTCNLCTKKFFTVSKRNTHVNTVHRNAATWLCRICDSKFTSNTTFRHHMRSKHDKDAFKCDRCISVFKKKLALGNHLRNKHHIYTCTECDLLFNDSRAFNIHVTSCQKRHEDVSFLSKYDTGMTILDGVNYMGNRNANSIDIPIESIKLISSIDKLDAGDSSLNSDMPIVNVHLLDEIDDSRGQSMNHSIEPICPSNLFESGLSAMQEEEINCLPLHQNVDKIHDLTLQQEDSNEIGSLSMIQVDENRLPLDRGGEIKSLPRQQNVHSETITSTLQPTDEIELHGLHFSDAVEDATHSLPVQVHEVEIPAMTLEPNDESTINDLSLTQSDSEGIHVLPFADYHERSLPLDHAVLSDHLVQIDGESDICSLARDKDWNLPLVLDHNDVQSISFVDDTITPNIDIPLCEEQNVLIDSHVSLENDISEMEYTLPVENADQNQYAMYLSPAHGDVK